MLTQGTQRLTAASIRADLPLLACLALLPAYTQSHTSLSFHDTARLIQLGVVVLAALAYFCHQWSPRTARSPVHSPWHAALAVLAIASVAASAVPAVAARELALMLGLSATVAATAHGLGDQALPRAFVAALVGSAGYAVVLCLLVAAPLIDGRPLAWNEVAVGYDNYRLFNHTQTVALPLLALLALRARQQGPAWWATWFTLGVYMAFLLCTSARGTALALMVATLTGLAVLGRRAVWPIARNLLIAGSLGGAAYGLLFLGLPGTVNHALTASAERSLASLSSDSSRLQLWRIAWDQIVASPWLGVGPMHYAHYPNPKAAHPHNMYLQLAAEWGLPMLLLVCAAIVIGLARLRHAVLSTSSEPARREGAALFVTCVAILADAFVSGNAVMPISQMWIALCLAWAIAWMRAQAGPPTAPPPQGQRLWAARLAGLAVAAAMCWLVVTVWPEAVDLKAHLEHVRRDLVGNAKTNPRFWSHGWF